MVAHLISYFPQRFVRKGKLKRLSGFSCQRWIVKITQNGKYIIAVTIALATVLVYLPSLRNGFVGVWDDNINIVENLHIRSLDATFFRWAFLDFHGSNWLPLTWISLAVDYAFWGLNPLGYHLTNIILHVLNTLVVVFLVVKLLQAARERTTKPEFIAFLSDRVILFIGGATGSLFGIHPVHVESVAWAAERKDVLCALFFLLSVMMYANAVRRMGHGAERMKLAPSALLSAFFFFILALLSKPMAVTLPVVLLILDWYPFNRIRSFKTLWAASIEKLPFIALSLASSIITILAQRSGDSIASLDFVPCILPLAGSGPVPYRISWEDAAAVELGPFLSLSQAGGLVLVRVPGGSCPDARYYCMHGSCCEKTSGIACSLGILCGNAHTCSWHCPGWESIHGRPVPLFAEHRAFPCRRDRHGMDGGKGDYRVQERGHATAGVLPPCPLSVFPVVTYYHQTDG